jgi:murein DD-endopeptidase MepM/ murein hydrolase activator NlpD
MQVRPGQPVSRGQVIARIHDQGLNSHLHWEIRNFMDGTTLFPTGTAGARGTCNGHVVGVGYTWDDEPRRANPVFYGYTDPIAFVTEHQP